MDWYISYFYQVRFMDETMVPVSTAIWDPKWYHDGKDNSYVYRDKNKVINGLRCVQLNPSKVYDCITDCPSEGAKYCKNLVPGKWCNFLKKYYDYLNTLDFNGLCTMMESHCKKIYSGSKNICLMVHEKPDNPCSERVPLIKWFSENGIELQEFRN